MAEALTFLADEVGKALALVGGGIGIAVKLNYEVMSVVVSLTTRIIHILLLLTQKTSELFSILGHDALLFVGDVGSGVMAVSNTASNFVNGFGGAVGALGRAALAACCYVCATVGHAHASLVGAVVGVASQAGAVLQAAKEAFILFGSSVVFAISFLPNLVCLLVSGFANALVTFWWKSSLFLQKSVFYCKHLIRNSGNSVWEYFSDIPIHAVLGVCLGMLIIFGWRYLLQYMTDNFILIPDIPLPSLFTITRRRMLNWYVRVWRNVNRLPDRENSTDEEVLDDDDDNDDDDDEDSTVEAEDREPTPPPPPPVAASSNSSVREEGSMVLRPRGRRPIGSTRRGALGLGVVVTEEEVVEATQAPKASWQGGDVPSRSRDLRWAKQLYKELEDEKEGKLCIICQDRPKRVILLPCRHLCLCESCRSAVITRDNSCPICRKPILDSLRVYL